MHPNLNIDTNQIKENTQETVKRLKPFNISLTAVTKCTGGNHKVVEAFKEGGASAIGDSRLYNLKKLTDIDIEKWLIRIPMISEAENAVLYSDLSLNSEVSVLEALDHFAQLHKKKHNVILMIDIGDLREGWFNLDEFYSDLEKIKKLKNLNIKGIGTNTNCAGAIIPEPSTYEKFPEIIETVATEFDIENPIVSGGNSGAYYMVENKTIPQVINNLRMGEVLLFGSEASFQKEYDYLNHDIFSLHAEIIEIKKKPSYPIGKQGKDAFRKKPVFEDKGIRKRALLAVGKQDIQLEDLTPYDETQKIITASSDHLILDITDCPTDYKVGDVIPFKCNYAGALSASTSEYVKKTYS